LQQVAGKGVNIFGLVPKIRARRQGGVGVSYTCPKIATEILVEWAAVF